MSLPIQSLPIIFENDVLIAINKPHGLLVHRTRLAPEATAFALQILRDQIGQPVWPAHRLDRKTSGVLLFAKTKAGDSELQQLFQNRKVTKVYKAIVRGWLEESGTIDYALTSEEKTKEATTHYKRLEQFEIDLPFGQHATSRYSLVELHPETGRFHQLRKHMAHIHHPILGDRPHGCNKQNRLWKEEFGMVCMMLHAARLELEHGGEKFVMEAGISGEFERVLCVMRGGDPPRPCPFKGE